MAGFLLPDFGLLDLLKATNVVAPNSIVVKCDVNDTIIALIMFTGALVYNIVIHMLLYNIEKRKDCMTITNAQIEAFKITSDEDSKFHDAMTVLQDTMNGGK